MWITVRSERVTLTPRMRRKIESFVRDTFEREQNQIASCVVQVGPAKLGRDDTGFACRINLWSSYLGTITVRDAGDTLRTAVQVAALRARHTARRRLHKQRSRARRLGQHRVSHLLAELAE